MQKNKLVLFGTYPPPYGGVSTYMQNLYKLMLMHNHPFKLLAFRSHRVSGENIIQISSGVWGLLSLFINLINVNLCLDSTEFCLEYPSWKRGYLWLLMKLITGFKWIKILHDGSLPARYRGFSPLRRRIFNNMLKHIDQLIAVNHELANWIRTDTGYRGQMSVIGSLLPSNENKEDLEFDADLAQFIHTHEKLICSIGIFSKAYGFDDIVDAVESLRLQLEKNIGIIFIDAAFDFEVGFREKAIGDRAWIFTISSVPAGLVKSILKRVDVFVRATQYESYGLSRVEAIFCEKPVVATNVGETRGMLLYESGDRKMLKDQIRKALLSPNSDVIYWREFYREQARENWSKLRQLLENGQ